MKFNWNKDISPKYLLIALSVICIALTIISAFFPNILKPVREVTGGVVTPLQQGVNDIGIWIEDKMQVFGDVKALKEENTRLRGDITNLQNELGKNEAELAELQHLRDLYDLDELYPDYEKTAASLPSDSPTSSFASPFFAKLFEQTSTPFLPPIFSICFFIFLLSPLPKTSVTGKLNFQFFIPSTSSKIPKARLSNKVVCTTALLFKSVF